MPAVRHSQPLHKVGPSFGDCQGRAHRRRGITSERSAGARDAIHPKVGLLSRQLHLNLPLHQTSVIAMP